jgi:hypothetical protein
LGVSSRKWSHDIDHTVIPPAHHPASQPKQLVWHFLTDQSLDLWNHRAQRMSENHGQLKSHKIPFEFMIHWTSSSVLHTYEGTASLPEMSFLMLEPVTNTVGKQILKNTKPMHHKVHSTYFQIIPRHETVAFSIHEDSNLHTRGSWLRHGSNMCRDCGEGQGCIGKTKQYGTHCTPS